MRKGGRSAVYTVLRELENCEACDPSVKIFDKERDITGFNIPSLKKACIDNHACKWPLGLDIDHSLAQFFDQMNLEHLPKIQDLQNDGCQVITFSHFLPRQELCPEKRMLFYPNLPKVAGSDLLEARLRNIHGLNGTPTACHVFGHTHFSWDATLNGVRYIQAPLAYPKERQRRMNGGEDWLPLCIYDSEFGLIDGPLPCYWSDYYRSHKRKPENIELSPWVANLYRKVESTL
ncbi:hypothetical protein O6H91_Y187300 [Diphasiastrum complanatum]|nr:hypothetical protein O6H91_Y187300 [Diphasiastrum complanatum]